jgi:hypothetical protein
MPRMRTIFTVARGAVDHVGFADTFQKTGVSVLNNE